MDRSNVGPVHFERHAQGMAAGPRRQGMRDGRREAKNLARTVARPAQPTPATAVTGYASARAWEGACQPSWRMAMGIGTRESGRIKVGTFEHNCGTSRRRQRRLVSFVAASPNDQPKQPRSAKDRQRWPSLQTVHTSNEEKSALYPPPCAPVHQARPPTPQTTFGTPPSAASMQCDLRPDWPTDKAGVSLGSALNPTLTPRHPSVPPSSFVEGLSSNGLPSCASPPRPHLESPHGWRWGPKDWRGETGMSWKSALMPGVMVQVSRSSHSEARGHCPPV